MLNGNVHEVSVPKNAPNKIASVIVIECNGAIETAPERLLLTSGKDILHTFDSRLCGDWNGGRARTVRYGAGHEGMNYIYNWKDLNDKVCWSARSSQTQKYKVELVYVGNKARGSEFEITFGDQVVKGTIDGKSHLVNRQELGEIEIEPFHGEITLRALSMTTGS